jgi:hypothetical protein
MSVRSTNVEDGENKIMERKGLKRKEKKRMG